MKPRKIVRRKEAWGRMGCGRTKFTEDYEFHNEADPYVPGTKIKRLRSIPLGPVNRGFLDHELDALIDALAEAGGHSESKAYKKAARKAGTGRVFLTDALPPRLARERRELLARRNLLRAQVIADADPELRTRLEEIERELRTLDQTESSQHGG